MRSVLLLLGSILFVAGGVFIAMTGGPEDLPMAIGVIAFFGACAIVGAVQLLPARRIQLDAEGGVTLTPDRITGAAFAVAAIGMAYGCYVFAPLALAEGKIIVGYVAYFGALFFGAGAGLMLWRLVSVKALARFDRTGAQSFAKPAWALRWTQVRAISTFVAGPQMFLRFEPSERDATTPPVCSINLAGTRYALEELRAAAAALQQGKTSL